MDEPKTIYDLGYFKSREEAERMLKRFSETKVLTLPEHGIVMELVRNLNNGSRSGVTAGDLLLAYQRLRESHEHTDAICAWKDSTGSKCGGLCDIEVDAVGAFYLCRVDQSHRTPK